VPPTPTPTPAPRFVFLGFWGATSSDPQPQGGAPFNPPAALVASGDTITTCGVQQIYGWTQSDESQYTGFNPLTVDFAWYYDDSLFSSGTWKVVAKNTWYRPGGGDLNNGTWKLVVTGENGGPTISATVTLAC